MLKQNRYVRKNTMKQWINGVIWSGEKDLFFHSITVDEKGIITGTNESPRPNIEIIDLNGQLMMPAFVDCHLHIVGYGQMLSRLNVSSYQTNEEVIEAIKNYIDLNPLLPYYYFEGYQLNMMTKNILEGLSSKPIYVRHADYHGLTVNDIVLQMHQLSTKDGVLLEDAAMNVLSQIPKHDHNTLLQMTESAIKKLYSFGIIAGHTDDLYYFNGYYDTLKVLKEATINNPFFIHELIHYETLDDALNDDIYVKHPYVSLGAVKMFYDGTTSSHTALMTSPYTSGGQGERVMGDRFEQELVKARLHQKAVAVHVIGDQGLHEVALLLQKHPVQQGLIDRIIHASYAKKDTLDILKQLPVFLDIQPQFLTSDLPHTLKFFTEAPSLIFPFKSYHDAQLHYGFSSDAPVELPNPFLGMKAAIFRRNHVSEKVLQPEEKMHRLDAINAYTKHAWALTTEQGGQLIVDMPCHAIILSHDLFHIEEEDFNDIYVKETWLKGKRVF
jgi:predicted amidohydrolase YtcJ